MSKKSTQNFLKDTSILVDDCMVTIQLVFVGYELVNISNTYFNFQYISV